MQKGHLRAAGPGRPLLVEVCAASSDRDLDIVDHPSGVQCDMVNPLAAPLDKAGDRTVWRSGIQELDPRSSHWKEGDPDTLFSDRLNTRTSQPQCLFVAGNGLFEGFHRNANMVNRFDHFIKV